MENINREIEAAADNTNKLMLGEFNFSKKKNILNKTLISDTSKIDEKIIRDSIIEGISNKYNDEFYIKHQPGSNYFTLRRENGR